MSKDKNKDKPKNEEVEQTKEVIIDGDKPGGGVPPRE
jgi:hypothetical protein